MVPSDFRRHQNNDRVPTARLAPTASQRCNPLQAKSRRPPMASARTFEDLVAIMDRLREPGGCPWDREQTYATLRGYLIEECYEVVDALDRADLPALCEELGDLLVPDRLLGAAGAERTAPSRRATSSRGSPPRWFAATRTSSARRHGDGRRGSPRALGGDQEEREAREMRGPAPDARCSPGSRRRSPPRQGSAAGDRKRLGSGSTGPNDAGVVDEARRGDRRARGRRRRVTTRAAVTEELGDALFTVAMLARRLDVDADAALGRGEREVPVAVHARRGVRFGGSASRSRSAGPHAPGPAVERGQGRTGAERSASRATSGRREAAHAPEAAVARRDERVGGRARELDELTLEHVAQESRPAAPGRRARRRRPPGTTSSAMSRASRSGRRHLHRARPRRATAIRRARGSPRTLPG